MSQQSPATSEVTVLGLYCICLYDMTQSTMMRSCNQVQTPSVGFIFIWRDWTIILNEFGFNLRVFKFLQGNGKGLCIGVGVGRRFVGSGGGLWEGVSSISYLSWSLSDFLRLFGCLLRKKAVLNAILKHSSEHPEK